MILEKKFFSELFKKQKSSDSSFMFLQNAS